MITTKPPTTPTTPVRTAHTATPVRTTPSPRRAEQQPKQDRSNYTTSIGTYTEKRGGDSPYQNIALTGLPGSGKTAFAMTACAPEESSSKMLVLDFDNGLRTGHQMGYNPQVFTVDPLDVYMFDKIRKLAEDCVARAGEFAPGGKYAEIEVVVLDANTGLSWLLQDSISRKQGHEPLTGKVTGSGDDSYVLWRALRAQLRFINNLFKEAPVHFISIAHVGYREDKEKNLVPTVDIDGSFRNDFVKMYDEVYYLEVYKKADAVEYRTYIKAHKTWDTKSRLILRQEWLPGGKPYVVNATFPMLLDIAREAKVKGESVGKTPPADKTK